MSKRLTVAERKIKLFFYGDNLHDLRECYRLDKPKWHIDLALYAFYTINRLSYKKKQKLLENSIPFDSDPNSFNMVDDVKPGVSISFKSKILGKKPIPPTYHKLTHNFFIKIIGQNDYASVKDFLIRNGFMEVELRDGKETYKVSTSSTLGFGKGYRITKKYRFIASKPETYTLIDKKQINRAKKELFNIEKKQNLELSKDVHQQQIRDMASFRVNMNEFYTEINHYIDMLEDKKSKSDSMDVINSITNKINVQIPNTIKLVECINRGDVDELKDHYKICAAGRMYTPFTSLMKIIRKVVKLKTDEGELVDTCEVDIDSCQPALFYVILLDHFKNMVKQHQKIVSNPDITMGVLPMYSNVTVHEFVPEVSILDYDRFTEFLADFDTELVKFKEILISGLYEYLSETHNKKMMSDPVYREVMERVDRYADGSEKKKQFIFGLNCERKKIKMAFIQYMFQQIPMFFYHVDKPDFDTTKLSGSHKSWYMIHKCLEVDLKLISKILIGFKLKNPYGPYRKKYSDPNRFKYFSAELRRREAKFMTETVLPALYKRGIKSLTVHDCVIVDCNRAREVEQLMNDGLKHLNIPTKVSI